MRRPATVCEPTRITYPDPGVGGVKRTHELGGCGRELRRTAYKNRKGKMVSLVICTHCDGYAKWPGRTVR